MGHGAPRTLNNDNRPIDILPTELSERLERALKALESKDESFGQNRADERHQQVSQAWSIRCNDLVEELRHLGKSIVAQHQVLCDCGQDGAGVTTTPWLEEAGERFPRMELHLKDGKVVALCDGHTLLEADSMDDADYPWVERAGIEWMVYAIMERG